MKRILNNYLISFDQLLSLNTRMASKSIKSLNHTESRIKESDSEKVGAKLLFKYEVTDVTNTPATIIYKTPEDWVELQDKILRVLTYKYYDSEYDVKYQKHHNYFKERDSSVSKYHMEHEMESCNLQEYDDEFAPLDVQVAHEFLPIQMNAQSIIIHKDGFWTKTCKLMRNFFTFKSCTHKENC